MLFFYILSCKLHFITVTTVSTKSLFLELKYLNYIMNADCFFSSVKEHNIRRDLKPVWFNLLSFHFTDNQALHTCALHSCQGEKGSLCKVSRLKRKWEIIRVWTRDRLKLTETATGERSTEHIGEEDRNHGFIFCVYHLFPSHSPTVAISNLIHGNLQFTLSLSALNLEIYY